MIIYFLLPLTWRSGEPPAPEPPRKPELAEDETIINPYYMRQLLQYGIRLGQQQNSADMSPEDLLREATVRLSLRLGYLTFCAKGLIVVIAAGRGAQGDCMKQTS
jgi:hypothetical protein